MTDFESRLDALEKRVAALEQRKPAGRPVSQHHGTMACYMRGCHCEPCRQAYTAYRRDKRAAHKPLTDAQLDGIVDNGDKEHALAKQEEFEKRQITIN
jgi:hypothetical protein